MQVQLINPKNSNPVQVIVNGLFSIHNPFYADDKIIITEDCIYYDPELIEESDVLECMDYILSKDYLKSGLEIRAIYQ